MNLYNDIFYRIPNASLFYRDCIAHAVSFTIDRMPDHSWRRLSSDQPLEWVLNHLDAVTTHFLILRRHMLDEQNERWGNPQHLELNLELRIGQSTYIFAAEMDVRYLEYFVERYELIAQEVF
jgi:hypothetical protein